MPGKDELRRKLKDRLAGMSPGDFHARGIRAAALLQTQPLWQSCRTVLIFLSIKGEIDTGPLLEAALTEGKQVFAPRTGAGGLAFQRVSSAEGPWERGPFGIREPAAASGGALQAADFPALVIAPGLGFDRRGGRLGRGGAYYDRFFAALDAEALPYFALGFCTAAQVLPEIPLEPRDKKMDGLCTEDYCLLNLLQN